MHPLIESSRAEIAVLCQRYGVTRLDLFGSILRSDFDVQNSDVDVVVEFGNIPQADSLRQYFV